jgi:DNA-binding NarL/FixJ family response regulator
VTTRPRVLIADDHPGYAKALGRVLSAECDVVGVVADGRGVTDAAARLQPVVVVVDVNLPNASGLEICRQLTQNDRRAKVIVITGMPDDAVKVLALAAGASAFLDKLSAGHHFVDAIRRAWAEST